MSFRVGDRIWAHSKLRDNALLLMLALAADAHDDGIYGEGQEALAKKIHKSVRQTQRLLRLGEDAGEIYTRGTTGGRNKKPRYLVLCGLVAEEIKPLLCGKLGVPENEADEIILDALVKQGMLCRVVRCKKGDTQVPNRDSKKDDTQVQKGDIQVQKDDTQVQKGDIQVPKDDTQVPNPAQNGATYLHKNVKNVGEVLRAGTREDPLKPSVLDSRNGQKSIQESVDGDQLDLETKLLIFALFRVTGQDPRLNPDVVTSAHKLRATGYLAEHVATYQTHYKQNDWKARDGGPPALDHLMQHIGVVNSESRDMSYRMDLQLEQLIPRLRANGGDIGALGSAGSLQLEDGSEEI